MPGWIVETITTPTPAAVGVTGGTPTITATQNAVITPEPVELVITGGQPLSGPVAVPSGAALTITGGTPTITQDRRLTPGAINLTITGGQPNVVKNTILTPTKASLAITGNQPTITNQSPVAYNSIGPGSTGFGSAANFNFTAPAGADVFVVINWDRSAPPSGSPTYGGAAMTLVATINHNNLAGYGGVAIYRIAAAGNGTAKVVTSPSTGGSWQVTNAIAFTGVSAVGTVTTATGLSASPSQSVTLPSGVGLHVFSAGNGGGTIGGFSSYSGATNRYNTFNAGSALAINTVAASGTVSATIGISAGWAGVFVPLS
ncbi:hypothetical protein SEA_POLLYWOG_23 [Mycobacterium phage Pollywog]|nr:hypothetical protein SEA_POLLYWOG_23 [Mycobacterium phage Pollywog]